MARRISTFLRNLQNPISPSMLDPPSLLSPESLIVRSLITLIFSVVFARKLIPALISSTVSKNSRMNSGLLKGWGGIGEGRRVDVSSRKLRLYLL
jgi:hypothetical protein